MQAEVSEKQALAFELFANPQIVDYDFGGGAGGGKSMTVTEWAVLQCRKYPGIRIGLGRNEISNLRKTTVQTLLAETHPLLGVKETDFRYSPMVDPGIYYRNGSAILLVDLAYAPTDPDYNRLGSLNLTHAIIEEMGEVRKKAKDVFSSRKNRYLTKKYNIVGKFIGTQNPATNFTRQEYYDPYAKLGGGDYQTWAIINDSGEPVYVEMPDGTMLPALKCFIKSLVTDNPFISQNYIQELRSKPLAERKRLLEGNWDYYHDATTLFKRSMFVRKAPANADDTGYAGCDPSRGGDDCTFVYIVGDVVRDIEKLTIPDSVQNKGKFVAQNYIAFCKKRRVGSHNAAVDIIGIGESVGDSCIDLGFKIQRFNAGSTTGVRTLDDTKQYTEAKVDSDGLKGVRLFDNIRSQNFYDMAQAANAAELLFDPELPHYDELCTQLEAHGYTTKERMIIVDKKDAVKSRIGKSPDVADGLQAAWWVKQKKHYSIKDLVSI
ncbi:MAG: hypothetical protein WC426_13655 [Sulfuriferula sp.]